MAQLEARGLTVSYGGVHANDSINLDCHDAMLVGLIGPNGAGKATTLLTLSGLLAPLEGTVEVLGELVDGTRPHRFSRPGLAHVPEDRSLFFALTVDENIRLGLTGNRASRRAAHERAMELLPALKPLGNRPAGLLSGGEQQMLAVARAFISEPKCLLVDEMSLGLAPIIVERLLPIVHNIADQTGCES